MLFVFIVWVIGYLIGSIVGGWLFDRYNGYLVLFLLCVWVVVMMWVLFYVISFIGFFFVVVFMGLVFGLVDIGM